MNVKYKQAILHTSNAIKDEYRKIWSCFWYYYFLLTSICFSRAIAVISQDNNNYMPAANTFVCTHSHTHR